MNSMIRNDKITKFTNFINNNIYIYILIYK